MNSYRHSKLDDFADYREMVQQYLHTEGESVTEDKYLEPTAPQKAGIKTEQADYLVVVERTKPRSRLLTSSQFTCYLVEEQQQANQTQKLQPFLTCNFSRGTGKLRKNGSDNLVGTLRKKNGELLFHANEQLVLTLTVRLKDFGFHLYTLTYEGQEYTMETPVDRKGFPTLRYNFISTRRLGLESANNFAINDSNHSRMLECLKVNENRLLIAVKRPFNPITAAVVGILRYRGKYT